MDNREQPSGTTIIKEWQLINEIGKGAFGVICAARHIKTNELVAIKLEQVDPNKQVLKLEVSTLKKLQCVEGFPCSANKIASPGICRLLACGRVQQWNYMVMNLLGENLSELRKKKAEHFSLGNTLKIGLKIIPILEGIHTMGYIHRDIKPSNFVIGLYPPALRREIFIIDFGLARRFLSSTGEIRGGREFTGFRGTARYASINSHMCRDLGRRDDIWSVFYLLVEFAKGSLPWRKLHDKDKIGEMKIQMNTSELVKGLPLQFLHIMHHLQKLKYSDAPDYMLIKNLLRTALADLKEDEESAFGWESDPPPARYLDALNFAAVRSGGHQVLFADGAGRGLAVTSDSMTSLTAGSTANPQRYRVDTNGSFQFQPSVFTESVRRPSVTSPRTRSKTDDGTSKSFSTASEAQHVADRGEKGVPLADDRNISIDSTSSFKTTVTESGSEEEDDKSKSTQLTTDAQDIAPGETYVGCGPCREKCSIV